jgi:predicted phosphodiesterase
LRVLLVSDIHANLTALEAVLLDCREVDAIWNLGDTVGYGPRPSECLAHMRELNASPFLVGNHDLASIGKIDVANFNPIAALAAKWTAAQLSVEESRFIEAQSPEAKTAGFTLAHGSPRHPVWEYILNSEDATENFSFFDTKTCFVGHTHIAMVAALKSTDKRADLRPFKDGETIDLSSGRYIINCGSVGQPRDRDPRAAYGVLDLERGTVEAHRVAYEVSQTQVQMRQAGLPDPLIARLARGQ